MEKSRIEIYNDSLTPEQRKEQASQAGKASGRARARHKQFRDLLKEILPLPINSKDDAYQQLDALGIKADHENAMMLAQIKRAMLGDTEAARFVRDTVGEKPTEAMQLAITDKPIKSLDLTGLSDEQMEALADQPDEE